MKKKPVKRALKMTDGIYEYTEREENEMWQKWKQHIKHEDYLCPVLECGQQCYSWTQVAEHFFREHLTCPFCWTRQTGLIPFASHTATCKREYDKMSPSQRDALVPF